MPLSTVMTLTVLERGPAPRPESEARSGSPELDLAARVTRGDGTALGELYDAHHVPVRAFCQRLLCGAPEAEDLVQETFLAAPSALRRFEGRASLRTFLISIAVNHARHHRRAVARRLAMIERFGDDAAEETVERPDETHDRAELAAWMARVLSQLPLDQRVAVVLCVVEERTSKEAAQIVGVAEATIRTRLFHARAAMRAQLERDAMRERSAPKVRR